MCAESRASLIPLILSKVTVKISKKVQKRHISLNFEIKLAHRITDADVCCVACGCVREVGIGNETPGKSFKKWNFLPKSFIINHLLYTEEGYSPCTIQIEEMSDGKTKER
jgi:hypothetical protein